MRKAGSLDFAGQLLRTWESMPEFLKDDVPEGLLVGLGTAVPVALMPNQDPQEKAAAVLGGIGGGILFGGAARRIGAMAGKHLHPGDLEPGSWGANIGRALGREGLTDVAFDALGMEAAPKITGEHLGRAIGRGVGDEVGAIGGTIGALALAQNADRSSDPLPQPSLGEVAMATVPGAVSPVPPGAGYAYYDQAVIKEEVSIVATPAVPGTITPDSMPPEQLQELLALFQAGEARLVGPQGEEHVVPAPLYGLMRGLLDNLKRGEAVTVLPHDALLTTQQAAQILNVSRPYLYRLIEENAVPVVMVGSHRRLRIHDVLQLREARRQVRRGALDKLSELGQEMQVEAV